MSVAVTDITLTDVRTLVVEVDDPEEAADHIAADWSVTLEPGSFGVNPSVTSVTFDGDDNAVLTVYPDLSPGSTYRVALDGASDTIAIPSDLVEAFVSIPLTGRLPVRQLLAIIGRQHQRIAGTGATIMREPWTPGDTRLLVKSTLKLPSAGAVFAGNLRFTYTSKTSGSLEGVTPQHETQEPISIGAFVTFDESSRVPQDLAL